MHGVVGQPETVSGVDAWYSNVGVIFDKIRVVTVGKEIAEPCIVTTFPEDEEEKRNYHDHKKK